MRKRNEREKEREKYRRKEKEREREKKRENDPHHCCGRAMTTEFAMSRPVASAGADSRAPFFVA